MAHINLPEGLPGLIGPMIAYPHTAKHLNALAESLLVEETSTFSKAERELVASYVSNLNMCIFCSESHGAVADYHANHLGLSRVIWDNPNHESLNSKIKLMLKVASCVQKDARSVSKKDVEELLALGTTERDIHDLVLIAAAFCMYNRYVDGLGTFAPARNDSAYIEMGKFLGTKGYSSTI